jgi:hypothetical protein
VTQLPVNTLSDPAGDQVCHFGQQSRYVLWFYQHAAPWPHFGGIGIRSDESRRGLVFHHLSVREDSETCFRRFHLEVTEDQFILLIVHLSNSFRRGSGRINMISASLQNRLQRQPRRWVIIYY